ncbi:MAG: hypothetical protein ABIE74_01710 [Pseudomonadota bacterium]
MEELNDKMLAVESVKEVSKKEVSFTILPIAPETSSDEDKKVFMELQLKMVTSSINHEYARREYLNEKEYMKKQELSNYMSKCRSGYDEARAELKKLSPLKLHEFEKDLFEQKIKHLTHYEA